MTSPQQGTNQIQSTLIPKVTKGDVWRFAKTYWSEKKLTGAVAVVSLGASVGADVFYPVMSGRLVDTLTHLDHTKDESLDAAFWAFAALLGIQVFHSWTWSFAMWNWNKFAVHNLYRILTDVLYKVQRFSTDWHINSFAGATVRKITRGMWSFDMFEDTIFLGFFPSTIIAVGMTIMLIINVPLVGWCALPLIALFVAASIFLALKVNMPRFRKSAEQDTAVGASIADMMTAISTVKSFARERSEDEGFSRVAGEWRRRADIAWSTHVLVDFARTHIRIALMIVMMGLTIWMWHKGDATPGDIVLSITSFFIISGYLRDIGRQTTELMRSVSEMEDAVGFWIRQDDIQDSKDAKALVLHESKGQGATITFDKVGFAYKAGDREIYSDLSVEIKAGEKVALVGASGSGKSTFVKLIQRLYDIQSGDIRIDGQSIKAVTQESLRRNIALVPQEPVLFHRSLAVNIAYGKPEASLDEIREAAREAYAADFIERLPMGYETLVGERGIKLSGGERQRVAIARALLADCPVLILDEATSSLDSVSEHYIQKALDKLMEGRTTITIAHRLATIQKADRILVFENGMIIEQGTHAGLLQNPDSTYRRLYEMQALDLVGE